MAIKQQTPDTYRGTHLRDSKGIYTWKDERFPSVTTILKVMDKPALPRWASKSVAEYVAAFAERIQAEKIPWPDVHAELTNVDKLKAVPWDYAEKKRDLGSTFHDLAERYAGGMALNPEVFASDVQPLVKSFLKFVEDFKPKWEAMECGVFNREHNYAGTMDTIMHVDGRLMVVDYKTGKDTYVEHALQLAAYRRAEFLALADGSEIPMPKTVGGAVLLIQPDGYKLMEWPCDDAEFDAFLSLRGAYDFLGAKPKATEIRCP
jgi:hypothetical protein